MASYSERVKKDLARWRAAGMIDEAAEAAIARDVDANRSEGFSIGTVLVFFGASLFAAAVLLLVAANWEALPRLARVGLIFALILGGHVGGAILRLRGSTAMGEGALVVGSSAFGAGIALVGQMYHLSGDEAQAILLWCAGAALAGAVLRSGPLAMFAVLIFGFWLMTQGLDFWRSTPLPHGTFWIGWLLLAAAAWWSESRGARHLLLLLAIFYAALFFVKAEALGINVVLGLVSAGLFLVSALNPAAVRRVTGLSGEAGMMHGFIGFLVAAGMSQVYLWDDQSRYVIPVIVLAAIVGALALGGGENRWLRWLAYVAFAFQLCYVYIDTLGSMLGAVGAFLVGGLILIVLALAIQRVERRLKAQKSSEGAAA